MYKLKDIFKIRKILNVYQWKNAKETLKLFNNITNKNICSFIRVDIKDFFYPSPTENILNKEFDLN